MSFRPVFGSFFLGVSRAFRFYEIGLWAQRPTPSLAGRPMVRLVGFLTANVLGMGAPSSSYATANVESLKYTSSATLLKVLQPLSRAVLNRLRPKMTPGGDADSSPKQPDRLHGPLIQCVPGAHSSQLMWPGGGAIHSPPTWAEDK